MIKPDRERSEAAKQGLPFCSDEDLLARLSTYMRRNRHRRFLDEHRFVVAVRQELSRRGIVVDN